MSNPTTDSFYWALEGTSVRPASFEEWVNSFSLPRHVARDERQTDTELIIVSTVFVGLNVLPGTTPLLFETMVFGGDQDGRREVYATWAEATAGHARIAKEVIG
jgi:hypothetical protein